MIVTETNQLCGKFKAIGEFYLYRMINIYSLLLSFVNRNPMSLCRDDYPCDQEIIINFYKLNKHMHGSCKVFLFCKDFIYKSSNDWIQISLILSVKIHISKWPSLDNFCKVDKIMEIFKCYITTETYM